MTGVRSRDGNVFNLFLRDITQKLAAEEQLRQAQKMEAVGQLTGGIAHDFNNLLTVITGTIEILARGRRRQAAACRDRRLIGEAAERGAELTRHLLAFARQQPLQPRDTDINSWCEHRRDCCGRRSARISRSSCGSTEDALARAGRSQPARSPRCSTSRSMRATPCRAAAS